MLSIGARLIDDFIRNVLAIPFCPIPFCPCTIMSIPFCPYHFVRYHFVLEPKSSFRFFFSQFVLCLMSFNITSQNIEGTNAWVVPHLKLGGVPQTPTKSPPMRLPVHTRCS